MSRDLASKPLIALPPPPARFTLEEWHIHNRQRFRITEDQNLLSERILEESERVRDNINEVLDYNRESTEMRMKEKINDIEFVKNEIERSRVIIQVEMEALGAYKERIQDALQSLRNVGKTRTQKCCILRLVQVVFIINNA